MPTRNPLCRSLPFLAALALVVTLCALASSALAPHAACADNPANDTQGSAQSTKTNDLTQLDTQPEYETLDELQNKRLGTVLGTTYDSDVWKFLDKDPEFLYYGDMSEMLMALKVHRIDACCLDDPVARIAVERNELITIMPEDAGLDANAIAMPKGSNLTQPVTAIVEKFLHDGTMDQLEKEWCHDPPENRSLPKRDWTGENGKLVCAVDDATEPMGYRNEGGSLTGLEVELANLVARELNMELELVPMSFDAITAALESHDIDMAIAGISITEERAEQFDLSPAYRSAWVRLVVRDHAADDTNPLHRAGHIVVSTFFRGGNGIMLLEGLGITVFISAAAVLLGVIAGLGVGLAILMFPKLSDLRGRSLHRRIVGGILALLRLALIGFEKVMLELPVVIVLLVLQFLVFNFMSVSGLAISIVGLSAGLTARVSAALRENVDEVDQHMWDSAFALGYPRLKALARLIIPLAWPDFIVELNAAIIQTVFDTSVVGLIAVYDITRMASLVQARTTEALPALVAVMLTYLVLSQILNKLLDAYLNSARKRTTLIKSTKMV